MIEIRRLAEWVSPYTNGNSSHAALSPSTMQAFYAEIEQMAGMGSWYYSTTDQTLLWSDELFRLHEIEPGSTLTLDAYVDSFIHPDDRAWVAAMFESLAFGSVAEVQGEAHIVSTSGHLSRVEIRGRREPDSETMDVGYVGIVQQLAVDKETDLSIPRGIYVSDLNQAVSPFHRSEPTLSMFVETAPQPVVITDDADRIVMINRHTQSTFGYTEQELTGQALGHILAVDTSSGSPDAGSNEPSTPRRQTMLGRHKVGQEFPLEVHSTRIATADGGLTVHFILDVSKHKRAEQELRHALQQERELSELKSRFVSIVSHEFRTPLAVIQATSETLRDFSDQMDADQWTRKFNKISGQVSHMTDMLEDILIFGKMASATIEIKREPVLLGDLLQDALNSVKQHYAKHTFITTCNVAIDTVYIDRKLINQTLSKLLANAAKYSAAGTKIWLDVSYAAPCLTIAVRDEGIGIPPEDQARLFEPFHRGTNTSGKQGTGLGLSIAKQAVELHGGYLTFESALGVGTTFMVTFPVTRQAKEKASLEPA